MTAAAGSAGSFKKGLSTGNGGSAICFIISCICPIWSRSEGLERERPGKVKCSTIPEVTLQTSIASIHSGKRGKERAANIDRIDRKQQQVWVLIGSSANNLLRGHQIVYLPLTGAPVLKVGSVFHFYVCTFQKKEAAAQDSRLSLKLVHWELLLLSVD